MSFNYVTTLPALPLGDVVKMPEGDQRKLTQPRLTDLRPCQEGFNQPAPSAPVFALPVAASHIARSLTLPAVQNLLVNGSISPMDLQAAINKAQDYNQRRKQGGARESSNRVQSGHADANPPAGYTALWVDGEKCTREGDERGKGKNHPKFDAACLLAKSLGGKYQNDSKAWYVPNQYVGQLTNTGYWLTYDPTKTVSRETTEQSTLQPPAQITYNAETATITADDSLFGTDEEIRRQAQQAKEEKAQMQNTERPRHAFTDAEANAILDVPVPDPDTCTAEDVETWRKAAHMAIVGSKPNAPVQPPAPTDFTDTIALAKFATDNDAYTAAMRTFNADMTAYNKKIAAIEDGAKRMLAEIEQRDKKQGAVMATKGALTAFQTARDAAYNGDATMGGKLDLPVVNPTFYLDADTQDLLRVVFESGLNGRKAKSVIMYGPRGAGKTETAQQFAARHGMAFLKQDGAIMTEAPEWFGYHTVEQGTVEYHPSRFVGAVERGYCVVLVDEISRIPGPVQGGLLGLMDNSGGIYLEQLGRVVKPGPCVYWFATANMGAGYNVYNVDAAVADRFSLPIQAWYPEPATEARILIDRVGLLPTVSVAMVAAANAIRDAWKTKREFAAPVSTRKLLDAAYFAVAGCLPSAIARCVSNDYQNEQERTKVQTVFENAIEKAQKGN